MGSLWIDLDLTDAPSSRFHGNRRNQPGDRAKALEEILPIVESGGKVVSDVYCLCGRIYKDIFMSSGFSDQHSRDQACYWYACPPIPEHLLHRLPLRLLHPAGVSRFLRRYGKAFETEQTLHSGINNVVLLMAAGHQLDSSIELRKKGSASWRLFGP